MFREYQARYMSDGPVLGLQTDPKNSRRKAKQKKAAFSRAAVANISSSKRGPSAHQSSKDRSKQRKSFQGAPTWDQDAVVIDLSEEEEQESGAPAAEPEAATAQYDSEGRDISWRRAGNSSLVLSSSCMLSEAVAAAGSCDEPRLSSEITCFADAAVNATREPRHPSTSRDADDFLPGDSSSRSSTDFSSSRPASAAGSGDQPDLSSDATSTDISLKSGHSRAGQGEKRPLSGTGATRQHQLKSPRKALLEGFLKGEQLFNCEEDDGWYNRSTYTCKKCEETASSWRTMERHMWKAHKLRSSAVLHTRRAHQTYACQICDQQVRSIQSFWVKRLFNHLKK